MLRTFSLVSGSLLHTDGFLASKRDILFQMAICEDGFYFVSHHFLWIALLRILTFTQVYPLGIKVCRGSILGIKSYRSEFMKLIGMEALNNMLTFLKYLFYFILQYSFASLRAEILQNVLQLSVESTFQDEHL